MNILVSSDKNYLSITATMLFSLANNNAEKINVWFLYNGINEEDREEFKLYLKNKCEINVTFVQVDKSLFQAVKIPLYIKHISIETYYRLIAQFLLPDNLDRILWIDSDIIVKGSISEFYYQKLDNIPLAACSNMGEGVGKHSNKARLSLKEESIYFNAGVLLLNLDYLRKNTTMSEIFDFCSANIEKIRLQDQDILNLMFDGQTKVWTNQLYNCIANSPQDYISTDICEKCAIIHYAGWQKPWKLKWQDNNSKYYWTVKENECSLSYKEKVVKYVGYMWYKIYGNNIISWLCIPYNWIKAKTKL